MDRNPVLAPCEIESETVNAEDDVLDTIDAVMPDPPTWTEVAPAAEAGRCAAEEGTEHATFLELLDRVKWPDV